MLLKRIITLCFTLVLFNTQAQYELKISIAGENKIVDTKKFEGSFSSTYEREKKLNRCLQMFHENAYLLASVDSLYNDSATITAYINPGKEYQWAYLKKGNVDEGVLSATGYREKIFSNKPFYYKDVSYLQEKIIRYYENNGYPFASVKLDSIAINNESISATLLLTKNKLIKIDSVIIMGNARISTAYLYNYTGIAPAKIYNESIVKNISSRLKELPFIKINKSPVILFTDKYTKAILFIDKKKASRFDGIVGVLPNESTGKILLTGDIKLKLHNAAGQGELIDINWRSLAKNTQDLKARISYPFLLSTPFGLDYVIKLYKKDTSFIDINQNIGVQYLMKGNNYFKAFYKARQSSLLSTKGLESITVLPSYADIKANIYGLEYSIEKLDYRLNPRKGFTLLINASAGNRIILKNNKLNPVIYEGLELKTVQYESEFSGNIFIPLFEKSTLQIRSQAAWLNSKTIFQNELYRIGGIKTLRGFDEESIFASTYVIGSIEYRYLLEENSYLYVFTDAAYYENLSVTFSGDRYDVPIGFGSGISFETKAGIFSINYALGKQFNNPVFLKSGKVHFGIVNYF